MQKSNANGKNYELLAIVKKLIDRIYNSLLLTQSLKTTSDAQVRIYNIYIQHTAHDYAFIYACSLCIEKKCVAAEQTTDGNYSEWEKSRGKLF